MRCVLRTGEIGKWEEGIAMVSAHVQDVWVPEQDQNTEPPPRETSKRAENACLSGDNLSIEKLLTALYWLRGRSPDNLWPRMFKFFPKLFWTMAFYHW